MSSGHDRNNSKLIFVHVLKSLKSSVGIDVRGEFNKPYAFSAARDLANSTKRFSFSFPLTKDDYPRKEQKGAARHRHLVIDVAGPVFGVHI